MPLSRGQVIAWSLAGLAVLALGAGYLRSYLSGPQPETATTITISTRESQPARIKIHIVGAVARPGLYEANSGDRVDDALRLAGGPTAAADLAQINLAAKIADGQQLVVPEKGSLSAAAGASPSSLSSAKPAVNLNSATLDQLTQLDGVGPKTAQKIIAYRESHGGFKSVEELMQVPGIGEAKFNQIKDQLSI